MGLSLRLLLLSFPGLSLNSGHRLPASYLLLQPLLSSALPAPLHAIAYVASVPILRVKSRLQTMAFKPLSLSVTPNTLHPCNPCHLSRCTLCSSVSHASMLATVWAPGLPSSHCGPSGPLLILQQPTQRLLPCETSQTSLPSATVDPCGPEAQTPTAVISPHDQPSVHSVWALESVRSRMSQGIFQDCRVQGHPQH